MENEMEKEAIRRISNIAQEKNANWLGYSNISAMKTILELLEKKDKKINMIDTLLHKCDFCKDKAVLGSCVGCYIEDLDIEKVKKQYLAIERDSI